MGERPVGSSPAEIRIAYLGSRPTNGKSEPWFSRRWPVSAAAPRSRGSEGMSIAENDVRRGVSGGIGSLLPILPMFDCEPLGLELPAPIKTGGDRAEWEGLVGARLAMLPAIPDAALRLSFPPKAIGAIQSHTIAKNTVGAILSNASSTNSRTGGVSQLDTTKPKSPTSASSISSQPCNGYPLSTKPRRCRSFKVLMDLAELELGRAVSGLTEANVALTRCGL